MEDFGLETESTFANRRNPLKFQLCQVTSYSLRLASVKLDDPFLAAAQQFFCNFKVGCGTESSPLGSRVQKALVRELLVVNLRVF